MSAETVSPRRVGGMNGRDGIPKDTFLWLWNQEIDTFVDNELMLRPEFLKPFEEDIDDLMRELSMDGRMCIKRIVKVSLI